MKKFSNRRFVRQGILVIAAVALFYVFTIITYMRNNNSVSLRDKIAQMLIIGFHEKDFSDTCDLANTLKEYPIGGVIFYRIYANDGPKDKIGEPRNIIDSNQVESFNIKLQAFNTANLQQNKLDKYIGKLFVCIDQEGGRVHRLQHPSFKTSSISPQSLGNKNDPVATQHYAAQVSNTLKDHGFNVNFAPVVDVNVDNGYIGKSERSFSSDPAIVAIQAAAFIDGMHQSNIITSIKHYPGHGSSKGNTHEGLVDVSTTWKQEELFPYAHLCQTQNFSDFVMTTHVVNTQIDDTQLPNNINNNSYIPMTFSKKAIDRLRNMGFDGVVISDDMRMGAIAKNYSIKQAFKYAINAGVNMFITANHKENYTKQIIDTITELVQAKEIPQSLIDQNFKKIQQLKLKYNLQH